jgi:glucose-6-phosphate 1-dehydrogenase
VLSHLDLLQVLSVLTMERPVSFSAEDIRDEKVTSNHPTISGVSIEAG